MKKFKFNEIYKLPKHAGVYAIINELNNHKYVGSSMNIYSRLMHHRWDLRKDKHHSRYLQNAYNKYGENRFYVVVLEKCESIKNTLFLLEQKYLDLKPEYNICATANRPNGNISKKSRMKISKSLKGHKVSDELKKHFKELYLARQYGKKVCQYDLNGKFIKTYSSARVAGRELRPDLKKTAMITACCKGYCKSAYGYLWKYDNGDYSDISTYENNSMRGLIKRWNRNKHDNKISFVQANRSQGDC